MLIEFAKISVFGKVYAYGKCLGRVYHFFRSVKKLVERSGKVMEMVLGNGFCGMSQQETEAVNGGSEKWNVSTDGFTVNGISVSWGGTLSGIFVGAGAGALIGGLPGLVIGGVAGCAVAALYDSF